MFYNFKRPQVSSENGTPLADNPYMQKIAAFEIKLQAKVDKWQLKEANSLGIYRLSPDLFTFEQYHPADEYHGQLILVKRLEALIRANIDSDSALNYEFIKTIMNNNFNKDELNNPVLVKLRKQLNHIERDNAKHCIII